MNAIVNINRPAPVLYWPGETNRCPCCGGKAWYVGRTTAQCAACDQALPLAQAPDTGNPHWDGPDSENDEEDAR